MKTDFLTKQEKDLIKKDVSDLIDDKHISDPITYYEFLSTGTFDPATGKKANVFGTIEINAVHMPISSKEITETGGFYQLGDAKYIIKRADVGTPKVDDRLKDGVVKHVFSVVSDPLDIYHIVIVRNLS